MWENKNITKKLVLQNDLQRSFVTEKLFELNIQHQVLVYPYDSIDYQSIIIVDYPKNYAEYLVIENLFDQLLYFITKHNILIMDYNDTQNKDKIIFKNIINQKEVALTDINNWHSFKKNLLIDIIKDTRKNNKLYLKRQNILNLNELLLNNVIDEKGNIINCKENCYCNLTKTGIEILTNFNIPSSLISSFYTDLNKVGNSTLFDFDLDVIKKIHKTLKESYLNLSKIKYFNVNIFPKNFTAGTVNDLIEAIIDLQYNLKLINKDIVLVLELVEYEGINNEIIEKLQHLKDTYGILIALDDFGNGYFSYEILKKLNPDIIKIDKTLLKLCLDEEYNLYIFNILVNFVLLAKTRNIKIVFEGIESKEILKNVIKLQKIYNYNELYIQGYYLHKPEIYSNLTKITNNTTNKLVKTISA
jgi:EAL domain-containing protein (putative c-di-GMP-specific phosphodiesterase class I)